MAEKLWVLTDRYYGYSRGHFHVGLHTLHMMLDASWPPSAPRPLLFMTESGRC